MAQHANRRLAAIVSVDVAGYSRLMGADEEGTLGRLKTLRAELVDPNIAEHGRIVKTTGDGLLLEFSSVVSTWSTCWRAFAWQPAKPHDRHQPPRRDPRRRCRRLQPARWPRRGRNPQSAEGGRDRLS